MSDQSFELGRHEESLKNMDERLKHVEERVEDMYEILIQARGGWKTMVIIGTVLGAVFALFSKILAVLSNRGG